MFQSNDICAVQPAASEGRRHFLRCTLPFRLTDVADTTAWGLWAEIAEKDATRVVELWDDPLQQNEPPFAGAIANQLPGYPETLGLAVIVKLTGPTTRPELSLPRDLEHPLALEFRSGVPVQRVLEWLEAMGVKH